jgi:hypothetical protein
MGVLDDIEDVADQMINSRAPESTAAKSAKERRVAGGETISDTVDSMAGKRINQSTDAQNQY